MLLKEWREKHNISQAKLAAQLERHAESHIKKGDKPKRLPQRTLGYWEQGVMPRKFWLNVVESFTHRQVRSNDFAAAEITHG